jgi:hypothetical protein
MIDLERAVLILLLDEGSCWTVEALRAELGVPVQDAVASLEPAGLADVRDGLVTASEAARRFDALRI